MSTRIAGVLARLRSEAGLSCAALAALTHAGRGWVSNVERGKRWPTAKSWVVAADKVLGGRGELIAVWEDDLRERERQQEVQSLVLSTGDDAVYLLSMPDAADLDELHGKVADLAVRYLSAPPEPMLRETVTVNRELLRRLRDGAYAPSEQTELYVALARAAGILAYAALDLGDAGVAARHAGVAFKMAALADHNELRAWARGTQALVARFERDYARSAALIADGLRYAHPRAGTSRPRLLSGAAQSAANLGDAQTAVELLDQGEAERLPGATDEIEGLFGFSAAKQRYYASSTLMWLPDRRLLARSARSARDAVEIWKNEPIEQRSLDDEALAHVYEATAQARLGDISAAMAAVQPALDLPAERHISWITKRVAELRQLIASGAAAGAAEAKDARGRLSTGAGRDVHGA